MKVISRQEIKDLISKHFKHDGGMLYSTVSHDALEFQYDNLNVLKSVIMQIHDRSTGRIRAAFLDFNSKEDVEFLINDFKEDFKCWSAV